MQAEEDKYCEGMVVDEQAEKATINEQICIEEKENLRKEERKEKQREIDKGSDFMIKHPNKYYMWKN